MIPPDNRSREEEYNTFLKTIQIGIFGYFSQSRIDELERVKESLTKRGLNVKMSIDLHEAFVKRSDETDAGYSLRISEELYNSSKVYIFVLIPPGEMETRLLDSVGMEYGWCYRDRKSYVATFIRKGTNLATLPQGALDSMRDTWTVDSYDNIEDIFTTAIAYCESAIREMFSKT
mgnify:CR=1 FL=1|jgi:hypothetical protein